MIDKIINLKNKSLEIRKLIIETAWRGQSAHVGSCLSCVDLLSSLYFSELDLTDYEKRDIFILSKAHAAMSLYSTFVAKGLMPKETLDGYHINDGFLPAHLDKETNPYIEASAGSLGHGFNIALGMAYGFKLQNKPQKVYTIIGDGEIQEGSIWEGAMFASKLKLDNFTAIIDHNNLQGYGRPEDICYCEPIEDKWRAFGWQAIRIDGHNFEEIISAFNQPHCGKPKVIIADTVKGKGVKFMEDELKWHYYLVTNELKEKAIGELNGFN